MSFGTEYAANPWLAWRGEAPTELPNVVVSPPYQGRVLAWAEIPTIVIVEVPTVPRQTILPRRRPTRMFERRTGQIRIYDMPPFDLLFVWKSQVRRHRNLPRMRRARVEATPVVAVAPTQNDVPWDRTARRVVRGMFQQRGKRWETTPPQFNPPFPFRVVKQPRVSRGLLRRKSKPVEIIPAQIVLVQSDVPWSRTQARALRGMLSRRMGHPVMFIFPGAAPIKAGTGVYLERDAIRIIPLITNDGGVTWRPRGT